MRENDERDSEWADMMGCAIGCAWLAVAVVVLAAAACLYVIWRVA